MIIQPHTNIASTSRVAQRRLKAYDKCNPIQYALFRNPFFRCGFEEWGTSTHDGRVEVLDDSVKIIAEAGDPRYFAIIPTIPQGMGNGREYVFIVDIDEVRLNSGWKFSRLTDTWGPITTGTTAGLFIRPATIDGNIQEIHFGHNNSVAGDYIQTSLCIAIPRENVITRCCGECDTQPIGETAASHAHTNNMPMKASVCDNDDPSKCWWTGHLTGVNPENHELWLDWRLTDADLSGGRKLFKPSHILIKQEIGGDINYYYNTAPYSLDIYGVADDGELFYIRSWSDPTWANNTHRLIHIPEIHKPVRGLRLYITGNRGYEETGDLQASLATFVIIGKDT